MFILPAQVVPTGDVQELGSIIQFVQWDRMWFAALVLVSVLLVQGLMKRTLNDLKAAVSHVKLFPVVLNGQTPVEQRSTLQLITFYEDTFGVFDFWQRVCVVVTRYSNKKSDVKIRA